MAFRLQHGLYPPSLAPHMHVRDRNADIGAPRSSLWLTADAFAALAGRVDWRWDATFRHAKT